MMDDRTFHARIAGILDVEDVYAYDPHTLGGTYRTRWNNRKPGNGRFEGCGIVRRFGDTVHVAIRHPFEMHGTFDTTEEAIAALEKAMEESR